MTVRNVCGLPALCGTFVALFLVAMAPPAGAQYMKNEITLSAAAGWAFPTGDLADAYRTGRGLVGGADFFVNPSWALGLRCVYTSCDAKSDAVVPDRRRRFIAGDAQARLFLYPESWFTPYAVGGAGVYAGRRWSGAGDSIAVEDETLLGLTGGFGLSVHRQGSRWSVYSELLYHHLPSDTGARQFIVWGTGLRVSFGGRPF